jgi:hypothetical protein
VTSPNLLASSSDESSSSALESTLSSASEATTTDISSITGIHTATSTNAQRKKRKSAAAVEEERRKKICLDFEKENIHEPDINEVLFNIFTKNRKKTASSGLMKDIVVGDYVFVNPDLSPGNNSHGGYAYVTDFVSSGSRRTFTVKYHRCATSGIGVHFTVYRLQ